MKRELLKECVQEMLLEDESLEEGFGTWAKGALAAGLMATGGLGRAANTDVQAADMKPEIGHRTGIMYTMPDGSKKDKGFMTADEIDAYHARTGGVGERSKRHMANFDTREGVLTVSGQGTTKEEAIRNALRNAIEQHNGSMVDASTEVVNDELVKDEITTGTRGNIEKYKVLDVQDIGDGLVSAKVRVKLGNNMKAELEDGEVRGGSFHGRTEVNKGDLVSDDFGEV